VESGNRIGLQAGASLGDFGWIFSRTNTRIPALHGRLRPRLFARSVVFDWFVYSAGFHKELDPCGLEQTFPARGLRGKDERLERLEHSLHQRKHPVQSQPGARSYLFGDSDHIHLAEVFKGLQQVGQIDLEHIGAQ